MYPVPDTVGGSNILEVLRAGRSEVQRLPGAVPVLYPPRRLHTTQQFDVMSWDTRLDNNS